MRQYLLLIPMVALLAGCPVWQSQDVPGATLNLEETSTGRDYTVYVPSYHTPDKKWPLVITLHGTHGWDGRKRQVKEWKAVAEEKGLIVVAPYLSSPQGILPKVNRLWFSQLDKDDAAILAVMDDVQSRYNTDPDAVLLTGFSAGGYAMYNTGLRHPERFNMLIARACNSSVPLFERIQFTDAARQLPVAIFWGKDDLKPIIDQSWQAYRYLKGRRRCRNAKVKETIGGHLRRPEMAYNLWLQWMPQEYRKDPVP